MLDGITDSMDVSLSELRVKGLVGEVGKNVKEACKVKMGNQK